MYTSKRLTKRKRQRTAAETEHVRVAAARIIPAAPSCQRLSLYFLFLGCVSDMDGNDDVMIRSASKTATLKADFSPPTTSKGLPHLDPRFLAVFHFPLPISFFSRSLFFCVSSLATALTPPPCRGSHHRSQSAPAATNPSTRRSSSSASTR